jgi:type I restriction enzyme S subunit
MGSNKLCEIADVIDSLHKTPQYSVSGRPMVRVTDVKYGNINLEKTFKVDEVVFEEFSKRYRPSKGDIIITRVGSYGITALVEETNFCLGQNTSAIIPKINPRYLYLAINSSYVKSQIESLVGGSTQKTLSLKVINNLEVPRFPVDIEDKIAEIGGVIDDKIELNQKTNQTLEKMAQALFKSWFVDFDPVFDNLLASVDFKLENLETSLPDELKQKAQRRLAALNSLYNAAECKTSLSALARELQAQLPTKEATQAAVSVAETPVKPNFKANPTILAQHANTHAHFPNEFEHNEQLGWIPKGWVSNYLDELVEIASSKRVFAKDYIESGVPFYRGKEITELSLGRKVNTEIFISEDKYQELKLKAGAPKFGDILITSVGTIGNAYLVNKDDKFYFKDGNLTWIKGYKKTKIPHYLIEWLKSSRGKESIENIKIGTTQQAITIKSLNKIKILAPTTKVSELFESYCSSSYLKVVANNNQSHNLANTRDTLLPKLISGELQIPDVATDEEIVD